MKILRKISNENLLSYQRRVPKLKDLELISLVINFVFKGKKLSIEENEDENNSKYKVLLSFDKSESGATLLKLADNLTHKMNGNKSITAMNIAPVEELHPFEMDDYEKEHFQEVIQTSHQLKLQITTLFKASNNVEGELVDATNKGNYDFLLIMLGKSIYEGTLLGKLLGFTTKIINPEKLLNAVKGKSYIFENSPFDDFTLRILDKTNIPVGIMADKNFESADKIFIPIFDLNDFYLIEYAKRFINNNDSQIIILDAAGQIKKNIEIRELIRNIEHISQTILAFITKSLLKKNSYNLRI